MLVEVRHFFPGGCGYSCRACLRNGLPAPTNCRTGSSCIFFRRIQCGRFAPIHHCASIVIEYDRNRPGIVADIINLLRHATSLSRHDLRQPGDWRCRPPPTAQPAVTPAPRQDLRPTFSARSADRLADPVFRCRSGCADRQRAVDALELAASSAAGHGEFCATRGA